MGDAVRRRPSSPLHRRSTAARAAAAPSPADPLAAKLYAMRVDASRRLTPLRASSVAQQHVASAPSLHGQSVWIRRHPHAAWEVLATPSNMAGPQRRTKFTSMGKIVCTPSEASIAEQSAGARSGTAGGFIL